MVYLQKTLSLCLLSLLIVQAQSYADEIRLFGQAGIQYPIPPGKFPRWDEMLHHRLSAQLAKADECEPGLFSACYFIDLHTLINKVSQESLLQKMQAINQFVNQMHYATDMRIYGVEDYWAVEKEFFSNEQGDCEDYAIVKYYALKALGFSIDDLYIAIVKDININIYHAILVVNYNNKKMILDNRSYDINTDDKLPYYTPIYMLNEHFWWFFNAK
jgi:predicted transglutaminase-like cysteine proteinase